MGAVSTASRVDSGDPQTAEISLLLLSAEVSIVAGLHDSLLSHLKVSALGTPIALSELQNLFLLLRVASAPLTLAIYKNLRLCFT